MKDYYRNAYLTISAVDAPNSHHGFLHERTNFRGAKLEIENNLFVRIHSGAQDAIFREAILNTRAWTLQERLLSTRILHFSTNEIFWECLRCSAREGSTRQHIGSIDPETVIVSEGSDFKRVLSLLHTMEDSSQENSHRNQAAMTTWYRLVTQYSRRSLTVSTDKLPAISGIAKEIEAITKYNYIAGIWKEDPVGLLWHFEKLPDSQTTMNGPYIAPSWSWATSTCAISRSLITQVTNTELGNTTAHGNATISASSFNSNSPVLFSQTGDGHLVLEARSLQLEFHVTRYSPKCQDYQPKDSPKGLRIPSYDLKDARNGRIRLSIDQSTVFGRGRLDYLDPDLLISAADCADPNYLSKCEPYDAQNKKRREERDSILCLPKSKIKKCLALLITSIPSKGEDGRAETKEFCLLTVEDEVQSGRWRRIGIGWTHHEVFEDGYKPTMEWSEMKSITLI